jgi:hypothetical protein
MGADGPRAHSSAALAVWRVSMAGAAPDADPLGDPLYGRLLFAGEHAQSARLV